VRAPRLLLVDDDVALLETLSALLSPRHAVDMASDPRDALARILTGADYDLVLCDLDMPHLTGPQLHETVERHRPEIALHFVFMTANATRPWAHRQPCLSKPLDASVLGVVIAQCLRTPTGVLPGISSR
jgi:CheY-like chemotaxis protein